MGSHSEYPHAASELLVGMLTRRVCVRPCSQSVLANVLVKLSGAAAAHFGLHLTQAEVAVQLAVPSPSARDYVQGLWRSTLLAALLLTIWGEERDASGNPLCMSTPTILFDFQVACVSMQEALPHGSSTTSSRARGTAGAPASSSLHACAHLP